jgi:hypothetical protein
VPIFSGIRLNDDEKVKAYKIDTELVGLGLRKDEALESDEDEWPIPRDARVGDFDE